MNEVLEHEAALSLCQAMSLMALMVCGYGQLGLIVDTGPNATGNSPIIAFLEPIALVELLCFA